MPKFKILAQSTSTYQLEIEAKDISDAWRQAHQADGGDFTEVGIGSWDIESVEDVTDDNP